MAKKEAERETRCPLCELFDAMTARCDRMRSSTFAQHLRNAQKEVLLAVRSVIDERIESLGKGGKGKPRSRRIKVTEAE